MSGWAVPHSRDEVDDLELHDARSSLAYWEDRADRLPLHAVRRRREAREMTTRWQHRVAEAEREAYGRGLLGMLALITAEGRLPEPARQTGRRVARRATQLGLALFVAVLTLIVVGAVAGIALLAAFLDGLL